MTSTAIIVVAIAVSIVLLAGLLLGRSIKIDTRYVKGEISRNGGKSALDKLHHRFDDLHDDLRSGLERITAVEVRMSAVELYTARESGKTGSKGDTGSRGDTGERGRQGRRGKPAA